jgi:hypothetical protein
MDMNVRWADVHSRHGRHVLGLSGIKCDNAMLEALLVPSVTPYCQPDVAQPLHTDDDLYDRHEDDYLIDLDQEAMPQAYPVEREEFAEYLEDLDEPDD